jgi:O-acetyl-ADP-ribose deacetylase (regulator of RNase III)
MNNRSKTWGGGFARAAGKRYPEVQADFRRWASEEQNQALGQVHFYGQPQGVLAVATIIAQKGFGRSASPRISYPHLEDGLKAVAAYAVQQNVSVHMPRIGCGQAGGNWEVVAELIDQHLAQRGIAVTVYDLPD